MNADGGVMSAEFRAPHFALPGTASGNKKATDLSEIGG